MIEWAQQMISGSSQLSNENLRLKQLLADHGLHDTVDAEVVEDK
jgi:hypothetical protein